MLNRKIKVRKLDGTIISQTDDTKEPNKYIIYTDGSCNLHDRAKGGWAAHIQSPNGNFEISGQYHKTTNNRMELIAVLKALETLSGKNCDITIISDSRYVTEAINKRWIHNWIKKGFKNVKNPDLWKALSILMEGHKIKFVWVKGHSGNKGNEICDKLANSEMVNNKFQNFDDRNYKLTELKNEL